MTLDGKWDTMPEGYPQLEAMKQSVEADLRFNAFTTKAIYGFTIKPTSFKDNRNKVSKALPSVDKDKSHDGSGSAAFTYCCITFIFATLLLLCMCKHQL